MIAVRFFGSVLNEVINKYIWICMEIGLESTFISFFGARDLESDGKTYVIMVIKR